MLLIAMLFLLHSKHLLAGEQDWRNSIVTDPMLGSRCEEMLEAREQKLKHKHHVIGLIDRNKKLQQMAPADKPTLRLKLEHNLKDLERELKLSTLRVENMTEDLIRKGCPGVRL